MDTSALLAALARELERPRELPDQVVRHLNTAYGIGPEEVGAFLDTRLADLEDYEIDLVLSPIFTPALPDQAKFVTWLGATALTEAAIAELVDTLTRRPTVAHLITSEGASHAVTLRAVTIARYVRRLRLDGAIAEPIHHRLKLVTTDANRDLAFAVARRSIWTAAGRLEILQRFFDQAQEWDWTPADLLTLLRLVEGYEPSGFNDFHQRLPGWIESVRREANAAINPKPFFNERVEELHGGGRDQRPAGDVRAEARQNELKLLLHLQRMLTP